MDWSVVPENPRQTEQADTERQTPEAFARRDNPADAKDRLEQLLEFPVALNDDLPAAIGHEWHISDEVNGIPKPLLGVQQYRAIFQWRAVPLWLSEISPG